MIAEIQNKPYDSSRYLNNNISESQSINRPNNQFLGQISNTKGFIDNEQINFQQQNISMTQSMAYDPRVNRFQQ